METAARIVAIETSGRQGSVAVALGERVLAVRELSAAQRHAVELMPAIRDLVAGQGSGGGWRPEEIQEVYLSIGPGSFTGLRIAVAIARGLAQAIGCRLVGVPSLDVIAQNAPGEFGVVVPVLDAKRGQVFAARYERGGSGELIRTVEPALVDPRKFMEEAVAIARGRRVALLGEGVDYHREALLGGGGQIVELDKTLWIARAVNVHRLGHALAAAGKYADPGALLPTYIRLAEAEEVYRKKHGLALS